MVDFLSLDSLQCLLQLLFSPSPNELHLKWYILHVEVEHQHQYDKANLSGVCGIKRNKRTGHHGHLK